MWKIFTLLACLVTLLPQAYGKCEKLLACMDNIQQFGVPRKMVVKDEFTLYSVEKPLEKGDSLGFFCKMSKKVSKCRDQYGDACALTRYKVAVYKWADLFQFDCSETGLLEAQSVLQSKCYYDWDKWENAEQGCYDLYIGKYQRILDIDQREACSLMEELEKCVVRQYANLCGPEVDKYVIGVWSAKSQYSIDYFCEWSDYHVDLMRNGKLPRGIDYEAGREKEEVIETIHVKYDKGRMVEKDIKIKDKKFYK